MYENVLIGHARSSENGTKYGKAGDSTGNEVSITPWYDRGWYKVICWQSEKKAEEYASIIETICKNDHVGYSQDDRYSLATELKDHKPEDVNLCNCDCSSLIAAALRYMGIPVNLFMTTSTEIDDLHETGLFIFMNFRNGMTLSRGNILLAQGHTATVLKGNDTEDEEPFGNAVAKTDVYFRERPDKTSYIIDVIREGDRILLLDHVVNGFAVAIMEDNSVGWTKKEYYEIV